MDKTIQEVADAQADVILLQDKKAELEKVGKPTEEVDETLWWANYRMEQCKKVMEEMGR